MRFMDGTIGWNNLNQSSNVINRLKFMVIERLLEKQIFLTNIQEPYEGKKEISFARTI